MPSSPHPSSPDATLPRRRLRHLPPTDYRKLARPWAVYHKSSPKIHSPGSLNPLSDTPQQDEFLSCAKDCGDGDTKPIVSKRRLVPVVLIARRIKREPSSLSGHYIDKHKHSTPSLVSSQSSQSSSNTTIQTPTSSPSTHITQTTKNNPPNLELSPTKTPQSRTSLTLETQLQLQTLQRDNHRLRSRIADLEKQRDMAMREMREMREGRKRLEVVVKGADRRCVGLGYELAEARRELERLRGVLERVGCGLRDGQGERVGEGERKGGEVTGDAWWGVWEDLRGEGRGDG